MFPFATGMIPVANREEKMVKVNWIRTVGLNVADTIIQYIYILALCASSYDRRDKKNSNIIDK